MRKLWSSSAPTPSSHSSPPCHTASPSCVPMPLCITAVPLRCPHNQIVRLSSFSLACQSAFCWLPPPPAAQPVTLLFAGLDCLMPAAARHGLLSGIPHQEQPLLGLGLLLRLRLRLPGAVEQGAGQPTGGYLSLFMTGSDPKRVSFTNPAQPRRVKMNVYIKKYRSHPAGQKTILMRGVIK